MHYRVSENEVETLEEGEIIRFSRTVTAKGTSVYAVNDNVLEAGDYAAALREISIDTKARNFLVFQGDVESVAGKGEREMLAYFELVSGSAELKAPYEEAQTTLEAARREAATKLHAKKQAFQEKKEMDEQKRNADVYSKLREDVERLQTQIALTRLFYFDTQITTEVRGTLSRCGAEGALPLTACSIPPHTPTPHPPNPAGGPLHGRPARRVRVLR